MSQSHRFKGGTIVDAFQARCFLWEKEASVDVDFILFNFKIFYMYTNVGETLKERKTIKKHKRSPFNDPSAFVA